MRIKCVLPILLGTGQVDNPKFLSNLFSDIAIVRLLLFKLTIYVNLYLHVIITNAAPTLCHEMRVLWIAPGQQRRNAACFVGGQGSLYYPSI